MPADCDQAFTKKNTGSDNHTESVVVFLKLGQAIRRVDKDLSMLKVQKLRDQ